ncbi:PaaI family thioesterase [Mycolicibacterium pulveris]|uniref:Acyl-coenzyme A thioesterase THEM4 n=1 Tax=Mycolicibacterium pulveris TaxID=36813 RepID=A0A7I7UND6_MYCPV|nr:PaaI family thioesterase [Mycolicibacterium pulveris]MCV6983096.1 PaaI family thioesterase [Mycolicibacterium pulveris]BBY82962.1 thioesterase [Mycolicibacterium pulveris]
MTDDFEPLTQSVRRLIDVTIRSEVGNAAAAEAKAHIDKAVELLSAELMPGSYGVRAAADGRPTALGNVLIGARNAIAPPLVIHHAPEGSVHTEFELGAAYEGPAGHVHGGVCALILDHVLAAPAHRPDAPAVTGTITVRYVRPTRLGRLRAEAWVDRVEGAKTYVVGHIADAEGATVEASGVFIRPKRR